tara:strand:- start:103 stop:273 length:171 start_codon:yes stop_codon:yes gene_type:complete
MGITRLNLALNITGLRNFFEIPTPIHELIDILVTQNDNFIALQQNSNDILILNQQD